MVYAYAHITVINPESLAEYATRAADALAKHGGKVESGSKAFTALDGAPIVPDVAAILSFPTTEAAIAWANDPELEDLHNLRRNAGTSDIILLA